MGRLSFGPDASGMPLAHMILPGQEIYPETAELGTAAAMSEESAKAVLTAAGAAFRLPSPEEIGAVIVHSPLDNVVIRGNELHLRKLAEVGSIDPARIKQTLELVKHLYQHAVGLPRFSDPDKVTCFDKDIETLSGLSEGRIFRPLIPGTVVRNASGSCPEEHHESSAVSAVAPSAIDLSDRDKERIAKSLQTVLGIVMKNNRKLGRILMKPGTKEALVRLSQDAIAGRHECGPKFHAILLDLITVPSGQAERLVNSMCVRTELEGAGEARLVSALLPEIEAIKRKATAPTEEAAAETPGEEAAAGGGDGENSVFHDVD
jgi:hypothetical protein